MGLQHAWAHTRQGRAQAFNFTCKIKGLILQILGPHFVR
jgi:hypothetical protein